MSTLSRRAAFVALILTLGGFLFASSAPSPLYVVYQGEWGFSAMTLTAIFAVYALTLLVSLLFIGSISDHIGRRPALLGALAIEVVSMAVFGLAGGVWALVVARSLQGLATGIAMGTVSAALLDLEPRKGWGALAGVAAPMGGLAAGALITGLLVDHGPSPTRLIFWLMLAAFVVAAVVALALPEPQEPDGRWRESLRPSITIPRHLRLAFAAGLPCMVATWALGGLVLSIGPSLQASIFDAPSHLSGGLPIVLMAGLSGVMSIVVRNVSPRKTAIGGLSALIVGVSVALVALAVESSAVFLLASAICGLGFGPGFAGIFRALADQAPAHHRAGLVSSILTVAYLAFSLPALIGGFGITQIGLHDTTLIYGIALLVVASAALALTGRVEVRDELPAEPELA